MNFSNELVLLRVFLNLTLSYFYTVVITEWHKGSHNIWRTTAPVTNCRHWRLQCADNF